MDVTTSAFGRGSSSQINQLPFYDEFARRLRPKLLMLVFVPNDFMGNSSVLRSLEWGWNADRLPFASAVRGADGTIQLRPPNPRAFPAAV